MSFPVSSLLLSLHLHSSLSFQIISYSQSAKSMEPGQTIHLLCKSDKSWEFCQWKHMNKEQEVVRDCLMEWKRSKGGVSVEKCADTLSDRISISGDYDSHECGLTISNIQIEDAGTWECEMEEYRWGDWVSGYKHTQLLNFDVALRTTTTTTTTSTTTTTTTTPTTSSQFTEISLEPQPTTVPEYDNYDYSLEETTPTTPTDEDNENSSENHDYKNIESETQDVNSNNTEGRADIPIYNDEVEFLAIEEAPAEVSAGMISGVVVVVICLAVGAALGGFFWNRKRKSIAVVTLHKIKDNSAASQSFLEDSEYHVSIVGDPEEEK